MRRSTPKLSAAGREYVEQIKRRSRSAGVAYSAQSLTARFAEHCRDCQVGTIKPEHVETFFYGDGGLADRCTKTTLGRYRNDLKQFLAFCHRRDWTRHTADFLLSGITEKSTRTNRNRYRLTRSELARLLENSSRPRDRALIAFVANTGCRVSEALSMRIRDVSFPKGEIYMRIHKTSEEVTTPMTADLERELRSYLTFYAEQVGGIESSYLLFPAYKSSRYTAQRVVSEPGQLNPTAKVNNPRTIIRPIAERAGIELEPGDGWHTIRRSSARIFFDLAAENGHDSALRMTQAFLNHKHAQTTEIYLGLEIERAKVTKMLKGNSFLTADSDATIIALPTREVQ